LRFLPGIIKKGEDESDMDTNTHTNKSIRQSAAHTGRQWIFLSRMLFKRLRKRILQPLPSAEAEKEERK